MRWALYDDLTPWYRLLDATEDHADEVAHYVAELGAHEGPPVRTLLELGAGAGNNGAYLKQHYTCTLTDLSPAMLDLSRALNPECEHALGDMRTLRLERQFDAVLLHDALTYMRTEAELRQAAETAFVHTQPGGVAIFAPDCVRETFAEDTEVHEAEEGERASDQPRPRGADGRVGSGFAGPGTRPGSAQSDQPRPRGADGRVGSGFAGPGTRPGSAQSDQPRPRGADGRVGSGFAGPGTRPGSAQPAPRHPRSRPPTPACGRAGAAPGPRCRSGR
jgi:SAM-dependent methyltransferase